MTDFLPGSMFSGSANLITTGQVTGGNLTASGNVSAVNTVLSGGLFFSDGSSITSASNALAVYDYTGNGVTTSFATGNYTGTTAQTNVYIQGVYQRKNQYNWIGSNIVFTQPPPVGTAIEIIINTYVAQINVPTGGSVTPAALSTGGPSWDLGGNLTVYGNIVTGSGATLNGNTTISGTLLVTGNANIGNVTTTTVSVSNAVVFSDGSSITSVNNAIAVYDYTGNGSQTTFSTAPNNATSTQSTNVYLQGVYQRKNTYTWVGTNIIFDLPPPAGTQIEIVLNTYATGIITPQPGSVYPSSLSSGGPSWDTGGNVSVTSNLTVGNNLIVGGKTFVGNVAATRVNLSDGLYFSDGSSLTSVPNAISVFDYTGNGVTTSFSTGNYTATSTVNTNVYLQGVYQRKNTYTWTGTTLQFLSPPPVGTAIEIIVNTYATGVIVPSDLSVTPEKLSLGGPTWYPNGNVLISGNLIAGNVATTALQLSGLLTFADGSTLASAPNNVQAFDFVGNGVTTIFSVSPISATSVYNTNIYVQGVYQRKNTYVWTGTNIIFDIAPPVGTQIEILINTNASSILVPSPGSVYPAQLSSGGPSWDGQGNLTVTSNVTAAGFTGYGGNIILYGNLITSGAGGNLTGANLISGNILAIAGDVTAGGNLSVTGTFSIGNIAATTVSVSNAVVFSDGSSITSATSATSLYDYTGDGVTTSFSTGNYTGVPISTNVYLQGVYQRKNQYSWIGSNIVFTSPPPVGAAIEILISNAAFSIGVPNDLSVTPAKLSSGGPSWDVGGNVKVQSNLTVGGNLQVFGFANVGNIQATTLNIVSGINFSDGSSLTAAPNAISVIDYTGDGVTTNYSTGNYTATTNYNTNVYLSGIYQRKNTYTWTGTTIQFTQPPPAGTAIEIVLNTFATGVIVPNAGSVVPNSLSTGGPSWDVNGNLTVYGGITMAGAGDQFIGPTADSAAQPGYTWDGDINTGMFSPGLDQIGWSINGTEQMRIDVYGNVGIGTSTITSGIKLAVNGRIDAVGGLQTADGIVASGNITAGNVNTQSVTLSGALNFSDGSSMTSVPSAVSVFDYTGDGVTTTFSTGNYTATSTLATSVYLQGVYQRKNQYTWVGQNIIFGDPPPAGTAIEIVLNTYIGGTIIPADGSVTPVKLSTGGPYWTTNGNLLVGTQTVSSNGAMAMVLNSSGVFGFGGGIQMAVNNSGGAALRATSNGGLTIFTFQGAIGSEVFSNAVTINSTANVGIGTATVPTTFYVQGSSAGAIQTLSDAATITPNFGSGNNFNVTIAGNRVLANPSNPTPGQSGVIYVIQDTTGSRTLTYGSSYKFPGGVQPTLTTTANAVDALFYTVRNTTSITVNAVLNVA